MRENDKLVIDIEAMKRRLQTVGRKSMKSRLEEIDIQDTANAEFEDKRGDLDKHIEKMETRVKNRNVELENIVEDLEDSN